MRCCCRRQVFVLDVGFAVIFREWVWQSNPQCHVGPGLSCGMAPDMRGAVRHVCSFIVNRFLPCIRKDDALKRSNTLPGAWLGLFL